MKFSTITSFTFVIASATETVAAADFVEYHGMDTNWHKQERNRWFFGFNGPSCGEWNDELSEASPGIGNVQCAQTGPDKWYYHVTVGKGDLMDKYVLKAVLNLFTTNDVGRSYTAADKRRICPIYPKGWLQDKCFDM